MPLRWKSNNGIVADREIFTGRIRGGELEMVPDPKTGAFVPVYLDAGQSAPPANTAPVVGDITAEITVEAPQ